MARRFLLAAAGAIMLTTTGLASAATAAPASAATTGASTKISTAPACGTPAKGHARCFAVRRTDTAAVAAGRRMTAATAQAHALGKAAAAATPNGYGPADIRSAYNLASASSGGATVAIVDAYDNPNAEADLAVYRSQYGLPACTTANGCFRKVGQSGTSSLPTADSGWGEEIALDLDMVSAACPDCHILLVEATSPSNANLGKAVNTAARLGAVAISNSYGGSDARDTTYSQYYNHPGIAVTASSGDSGYGVEYPASSHYVVAVGGTSLTGSATGGWSESAWSGAGSGCSRYNTAVAPSSADTGCSRRAVADVSAVADPQTGVAVYDTYGTPQDWMVFGGTSASSPIIASVFALSGNTSGYPAALYTATSGLHDVTTGSNGTCSVTQLCHARVGWDGPTGLGTPDGVTAF